MSRKIIFSTAAPKPHSPSYCHAVVVDGLIFCTGQLGQNPSDNSITGDSYEQATRALSNLDIVLAEAGTSLNAAVKLTVFLVDWNRDYEGVNRALNQRFPSSPPARSTVEVRKLARGALVEIEAVVEAPRS